MWEWQRRAPPGEVARAALEAALNTWREGGKPGRLEGTEPAVEVHDTPWSQGHGLGSYEIIREETNAAEQKLRRPPLAHEARTRQGSEVLRDWPGAGDGLSR